MRRLAVLALLLLALDSYHTHRRLGLIERATQPQQAAPQAKPARDWRSEALCAWCPAWAIA